MVFLEHGSVIIGDFVFAPNRAILTTDYTFAAANSNDHGPRLAADIFIVLENRAGNLTLNKLDGKGFVTLTGNELDEILDNLFVSFIVEADDDIREVAESPNFEVENFKAKYEYLLDYVALHANNEIDMNFSDMKFVDIFALKAAAVNAIIAYEKLSADAQLILINMTALYDFVLDLDTMISSYIYTNVYMPYMTAHVRVFSNALDLTEDEINLALTEFRAIDARYIPYFNVLITSDHPLITDVEEFLNELLNSVSGLDSEDIFVKTSFNILNNSEIFKAFEEFSNQSFALEQTIEEEVIIYEPEEMIMEVEEAIENQPVLNTPFSLTEITEEVEHNIEPAIPFMRNKFLLE